MTNNYSEVPVKEGQKVKVKIEAIGEKGDGISRVNGFVIIVPKTNLGEELFIEITAIRGRVGFGKALFGANI